MPERGIPTKSVKITGDTDLWVRGKAVGNPYISLKGLHTEPLTGKTPGLWWGKDSLGGARDLQRKNELCGFEERAGGTTTIVFLLSPTPLHITGGHHLAFVLFVLFLQLSQI